MSSNQATVQGSMVSVGHIITTRLCHVDNAYFRRIDKCMFNPVDIPNWIVLIYEQQQRFLQEVAGKTITDLLKACKDVGRAIQAISTATTITKYVVMLWALPY